MKFTSKKHIISLSMAGLIAISSISTSFAGSLASAEYTNTNSHIAEVKSINSKVSKARALHKIYIINHEDTSLEDSAKWALGNKIIKDKTNLDKDITRGEFSVIIANYLTSLGKVSAPTDSLKTIKDFKSIKPEYINSLKIAYDNKLMIGNTLGYMLADDLLTENELAHVINRLETIVKSEPIKKEETSVKGKVVEVSKYGNVTTSATVKEFKDAGFEAGDILTIKVNGKDISAPYGDTYSNVDNKKEVIVPENTTGRIITAINMGDFSKTYQATKDVEMEFSMKEKAGYKEEYEIRSIDKYRTTNRKDYSSDEVFANFRPIVMGNIAKGVLYRTSSPINPEIGRAKYANDLVEKVGVKTVINMADSKEELEGYFVADTFASPYYKSLYDKGSVKYLNMGVDFTSDDFNTKFKDGLIFLSENTGPFAVHCNEGKDRAGFISIVLEALMGGSVDEIKADYMVSYMNYYFVEKDSKQYEKIADSNVMKSLKMIANVKTDEELRKVNLSEKTEEYLKNTIKLDDATIAKIKTVLSTEIK